jgi:hypothetical protein
MDSFDARLGRLEDEFLKSVQTGTFIVSLGVRRCGKTFHFLSCLHYFITHHFFDEYLLVLPNFKHEQKHSYDWIQLQPGIVVFETFNDLVLDLILQHFGKGKSIFLAIDDCTQFQELFRADDRMRRIIFDARHMGDGKYLTTWFLGHNFKGIFDPKIRSGITWLFVHRIVNAMVMKAIWEEFFSLFVEDRKEFNRRVTALIEASEHPCTAFNLDTQQIDKDVCDWKKLQRSKKFQEIFIERINITLKNGSKALGQGRKGPPSAFVSPQHNPARRANPV